MRVVVLAVIIAPLLARADKGELYLVPSIAPALQQLADPFDGTATARPVGGSASLLAYYGVTHEMHVGVALRGGGALNVAFPGVAAPLADGSRPVGTLYQDAFSAGVAALLHYRFDFGEDLAPFAGVELGASYVAVTAVEHYPDSARMRIPLNGATQIVPTARLRGGLEYRFANDYVVGLGAAFTYSFSRLSSWQLEVPLSFGFIF